ncbi:hypothetical protein KEM48_001628 [Puccinia striiformis f. sp. tritici PST-130]|nr:hypothetical protein KEM48_001628 [Puccinia striiformis f. sp. tritici PST-130]
MTPCLQVLSHHLALRNFVSLIGLIGGGTCGFPRVKDTLEDACNDIRSLDSAEQMLAGPEDALPVLEIATGKPEPLNIHCSTPNPQLAFRFLKAWIMNSKFLHD